MIFMEIINLMFYYIQFDVSHFYLTVNKELKLVSLMSKSWLNE